MGKKVNYNQYQNCYIPYIKPSFKFVVSLLPLEKQLVVDRSSEDGIALADKHSGGATAASWMPVFLTLRDRTAAPSEAIGSQLKCSPIELNG